MSIFSLLTGASYGDGSINAEFIESKPYEKGFANHYEDNLKPYVQEFEKRRINALEKARTRFFIAVILIMMAFGIQILTYGLMFSAQEAQKYFMLTGFAGALLFLWVYAPVNNYSASIKSHIFPRILSFFGNCEYDPERYSWLVESLKPSGIIPAYDVESSEDKIIYEYKGVKINLFETTLFDEYKDSKGVKYTRKIFHGIFISLSVNKSFKGKTIIKKDYGKIINWVKSKFSDLEKVDLEDTKFEEMFEVYSSDQIEARYLLTTSFMERLLKLADSFKSDDIKCSFYNNNLLMMIPLKENLFEPGSVYEQEDFIDECKLLLEQMNMIFGIIDTLKLDLNIGM